MAFWSCTRNGEEGILVSETLLLQVDFYTTNMTGTFKMTHQEGK